ncbi:carbon starvation CstA family protein [Fontivita pretiosa]|uniref:carbon starvation CstA family protein n=1 Tax=Fontivita pretiosa TaxID=2989684 RepID=UPI003D173D81
MTILPVVALCAVVLVLAYVFYGRLVARWLGVDPSRITPAVEMDDGNDYVPAPAPIVLGGHFTAIAAAGPVVGPILAGLAFGWLPAMLWILLGAIFIGGVHDSGALLASIRHRATSITQVVRQHMSRTAYLTFLLFVWISLVYVIIAFADVTAGTFANFFREDVIIDGAPQAIALNGGAVVIGATAYLVLSVVMGLLLRFTKTPWYAALGGAIAVLAISIWKAPDLAMWLSTHGLSFMDTQAKDSVQMTRVWDQVLLGYCFIASIVPMWLLLQPRGVIGATFLYAALAFGVLGTLVGGWNGQGELAIHWPSFRGFTAADGSWLFPFLFITIACGACSGFHSIVASGTTSKQVRNERDVRPIGYGAMLLESMVAIFALACVMILTPGQKLAKPDTIYALGIGRFAAQMNPNIFFFAVSFGLLAFSSFVFDTLDVCTRLGRYVLQEMTGLRGISGGAVATLITLAAPSAYLWFSPPGSFKTFWVIFGTSNQLLAALTLVGVSVWLWRTGRPVWFALLPAAFMVASTGTALVFNFMNFLRSYRFPPPNVTNVTPFVVNMTIAAVLFLLGALVVFEALRVWRMSRRPLPAPGGFEVMTAAGR